MSTYGTDVKQLDHFFHSLCAMNVRLGNSGKETQIRASADHTRNDFQEVEALSFIFVIGLFSSDQSAFDFNNK